MISIGIDAGKHRFAQFYEYRDEIVARTFKNTWPESTGVVYHLLRSEMERPFFFSLQDEVCFFIEAPIVGMNKNYQTAIGISMTVGALAATRFKTFLVAPSKWKKETVGNGNATKAEVADWLASVKPGYLSACAGDQDLIDAAVISLYGQKVIANAKTVAAGGLSDQ